MASVEIQPVLNYLNDNYVVGDLISFETTDGRDFFCVEITDINEKEIEVMSLQGYTVIGIHELKD